MDRRVFERPTYRRNVLYDQRPPGFSPKFHATGVYIEHEGEILLLQRHPAKPEGGTWCVPGGKVAADETPQEAAIRETSEETGIFIAQITPAATFFVRYPTYDFVYHVFRAPFAHRPGIALKLDEHTQAVWRTPQQAMTLALIEDEDAVLRRVYRF